MGVTASSADDAFHPFSFLGLQPIRVCFKQSTWLNWFICVAAQQGAELNMSEFLSEPKQAVLQLEYGTIKA